MNRRARNRRPWSPQDGPPRKWQTLVVVSMVVVTLVGFYLAWRPRPKAVRQPEHGHPVARHGSVLVSLGDEERHFHVAAVLEKAGTLRLYTLQEDVSRVQEVDRQVLHATIKAAGSEQPWRVTLVPSPQAGDAANKTSQFVGKLPRGLWGQELVVTVRALRVGDQEHGVEFATRDPHHERETAEDDDNLFLTVGGKYTEADIQANGNTTAARKYRDFQSRHDLKPGKGERICPVTLTKASPDCSWVVASEKHLFCCPPCIGEFLRTAKERPDEIKAAAKYVRE